MSLPADEQTSTVDALGRWDAARDRARVLGLCRVSWCYVFEAHRVCFQLCFTLIVAVVKITQTNCMVFSDWQAACRKALSLLQFGQRICLSLLKWKLSNTVPIAPLTFMAPFCIWWQNHYIYDNNDFIYVWIERVNYWGTAAFLWKKKLDVNVNIFITITTVCTM